MKKVIEPGQQWLLRKTTELEFLELRTGAALAAPAGKSITMTVDGVSRVPEPGSYHGKIVLTVTDAIPVSLENHGELTWFNIRTAVYIEDNALIPEKSVSAAVSDGRIGQTSAAGVNITSLDDDFNAIYVTGNSKYTIDSPQIYLEGNGGDDFVGFGAAITASGNAEVTVQHANILCKGAMRPAIVANQHAKVTVNDSTLEVYSGRKPNVGRERNRVPWMLGLHGNCRATNIVDYGTVTYNRCHIKAENWGVMSTDDTKDVHLNVIDSVVEVTGDSGYGAYSIGTCTDYFSGTTIKVRDYGLIIANGPAGAMLKNNSRIVSERFGVMWHGNQGGLLSVSDSTLQSKKTAFLVKGCGPVIHCQRADIQAENGIILHLMDCDDPGSWDGVYIQPEGPDLPREDYDLCGIKHGDDVIAEFHEMNLRGDIYNSTTFLSSGGPDAPGDELPPMPAGMELPPFMRGPTAHNLAVSFLDSTITGIISSGTADHAEKTISEANNNQLGEVSFTPAPTVNNGIVVSLLDGAKWIITGTSYLTSLTVDETSALEPAPGFNLTIEVDGKKLSTVSSGTLCGKIVLKISAK